MWICVANGPTDYPPDDTWANMKQKKNSQKNLSQIHFVYHKYRMDWELGLNLGLRGEKLGPDRMSCARPWLSTL
jgi:hypothetical protein